MDTFLLLLAATAKVSLWVVPVLVITWAVNHYFGEHVDRLLGAPAPEPTPDNVVYLPQQDGLDSDARDPHDAA